jgi:hypothetical protein
MDDSPGRPWLFMSVLPTLYGEITPTMADRPLGNLRCGLTPFRFQLSSQAWSWRLGYWRRFVSVMLYGFPLHTDNPENDVKKWGAQRTASVDRIFSALDLLEETEPFVVDLVVVVAQGAVADGSIPDSDPDHVATRLHSCGI